MKYLKFFLREHRNDLILLVIFGLIFAVLFFLGNVPVELAGYGFLLCVVFALLFYVISYARYARDMDKLQQVSEELLVTLEHLPEAVTGKEYLYQTMLYRLWDAYGDQLQTMYQKEQDEAEYQALWAHQIKTPIAAIPESVLRRAICQGFLKGAIPDTMDMLTKSPPVLVCICADRSAKSLGMEYLWRVNLAREPVYAWNLTMQIYKKLLAFLK